MKNGTFRCRFFCPACVYVDAQGANVSVLIDLAIWLLAKFTQRQVLPVSAGAPICLMRFCASAVTKRHLLH